MIEALKIEFDVRQAEGENKGQGFGDDLDATEAFVMTDVADHNELGFHDNLKGMRHRSGKEIPCTYKAVIVSKEEVLNLYTLITKGDDQYHQR